RSSATGKPELPTNFFAVHVCLDVLCGAKDVVYEEPCVTENGLRLRHRRRTLLYLDVAILTEVLFEFLLELIVVSSLRLTNTEVSVLGFPKSNCPFRLPSVCVLVRRTLQVPDKSVEELREAEFRFPLQVCLILSKAELLPITEPVLAVRGPMRMR